MLKLFVVRRLLHHRAFLYLLIGGVCAGLDLVVFCAEIYLLNISVAYANFISTHIGLICSFVANSKYNFKVADRLLLRFLGFYSVAFCGYLFGHFFLQLGMAYTPIRPEILKVLSFFGIFLIQFTLNSLITFRVNGKK